MPVSVAVDFPHTLARDEPAPRAWVQRPSFAAFDPALVLVGVWALTIPKWMTTAPFDSPRAGLAQPYA